MSALQSLRISTSARPGATTAAATIQSRTLTVSRLSTDRIAALSTFSTADLNTIAVKAAATSQARRSRSLPRHSLRTRCAPLNAPQTPHPTSPTSRFRANLYSSSCSSHSSHKGSRVQRQDATASPSTSPSTSIRSRRYLSYSIPRSINPDTSAASPASPATASHPTTPFPLSQSEYHAKSDAYIDALVAQLEEIQEKREDVDVEYSAGVMTLHFPPHGTYVLNKQPPNKQIWLSSPLSGPKRYDWVASSSAEEEGEGEERAGGAEADAEAGVEGRWVYLRDGSTLSALLEEEVGEGVRMSEEG